MSSATSVSASAMAATSSAAAAAPPPCRLLGSGQAHLRLPPSAAAAAASARRRLLLRCAASGGNGKGGGGDGSGSDPVLEERRRRRQAELAARIASGEFTAQGPASVLILSLSHVAAAFPSSFDDLMESSLSLFQVDCSPRGGACQARPTGGARRRAAHQGRRWRRTGDTAGGGVYECGDRAGFLHPAL